MAGLRTPLSTLRLLPRGGRRMTRGQDGLLFLSCIELSSTTLRQFYCRTKRPATATFHYRDRRFTIGGCAPRWCALTRIVHTMKTLQANRPLLRKPVKRRHYDSAFKRHLVELTLVPGASVARIALDHRVNANILFRWRRHYLRSLTRSPPSPAGFVPRRSTDQAATTSNSRRTAAFNSRSNCRHFSRPFEH